MNHTVDTCPLTQFVGGLNLLHEADDDADMWLESAATAALAKQQQTRGPATSVVRLDLGDDLDAFAGLAENVADVHHVLRRTNERREHDVDLQQPTTKLQRYTEQVIDPGAARRHAALPPPMAVRLAADLRPSADGSAVRISLSCRQPACL